MVLVKDTVFHTVLHATISREHLLCADTHWLPMDYTLSVPLCVCSLLSLFTFLYELLKVVVEVDFEIFPIFISTTADEP